MSLQWLSAAAFLYAEIGLGVLFSIEFISNARWQQIFTSRLLALVKQYGNFLFSAFVLLMFVLFVDSVHKTWKYSDIDMALDLRNNPQAEVQAHMKLFRAQRNLYITGFSLFMLVVLRRMITLISRQATLEASHTAAVKQAQGAAAQAKKLMEENEQLTKGKRQQAASDATMEEDEKATLESTVIDLKYELREKDEKLKKTEKDLQAMKTQAEGLHKEYDRLSDERNQMEKKLRIMGDTGNNQGVEDISAKKDD